MRSGILQYDDQVYVKLQQRKNIAKNHSLFLAFIVKSDVNLQAPVFLFYDPIAC